MNNRKLYGLLFVGLCIIAIAVATSCKKKDTNTDPVTPPVLGCMDPTSLTYNSAATQDDGTCVVPQVKERALLLDFTATW